MTGHDSALQQEQAEQGRLSSRVDALIKRHAAAADAERAAKEAAQQAKRCDTPEFPCAQNTIEVRNQILGDTVSASTLCLCAGACG